MNQTNRNYEEKRDFIRMRVNTPVSIRSEEQDKEIKGVCRNLSGGGLLAETDSTLPMGSEVEIYIASDHGHSPILKARARITRVSSSLGDEQSSCLVGMEILEML